MYCRCYSVEFGLEREDSNAVVGRIDDVYHYIADSFQCANTQAYDMSGQSCPSLLSSVLQGRYIHSTISIPSSLSLREAQNNISAYSPPLPFPSPLLLKRDEKIKMLSHIVSHTQLSPHAQTHNIPTDRYTAIII